MSGRTKAALRASALMPLPNSHTMYLTRTRPMMRDRNVEAIKTRVAVNAVCAWEGRMAPSRRDHREGATGRGGAGRNGSVEDALFTLVDFSGIEACQLLLNHEASTLVPKVRIYSRDVPKRAI